MTRPTLTRRPLLAAMALTPTAAWAAESIEGVWSGVLQASGQSLRLRFEFAAGSAKLFSLDQGGSEIPAKATSLDPTRIVIEVPAVRGGFTGRLVAPDRIEGAWTQGAALPLVLTRGEPAAAAVAAVQPLTPERLKAARIAAGAPAIAAGVQRRGQAAKHWADGERAVGSGVAVTDADQWHLGSITKSMTATLVGRLVDQGKVRWDDTVGDTLSAIAPDMREAYRRVTFRHLLSHRSGLPGNLPIGDLVKFSRDNPDPRDERRDYVRRALALEPKGPAETTFEYANNGYVTAGVMLESRLGETWETLIRRHLFEPLGLKSAGFGAPGVAGALEQPVGHNLSAPGATVRRAYPLGGLTDNPVVLGPAGRVHMSLADLLAYLAAHRDLGDLLKPDTWAVLHKPPFGGDYAMGWVVRPDGSRWHNGSNTLWYAEAAFDAKTGLASTAVSNDASPPTPPAVGQVRAEAAAAG